MANTTFNGPVRSENGFDLVKFNATTGATITDIGLEVFEQSVTVANGATTGTSTATMPTNFIVLSAVVVVTTAATNGVYLTDVGTAVLSITKLCKLPSPVKTTVCLTFDVIDIILISLNLCGAEAPQ